MRLTKAINDRTYELDAACGGRYIRPEIASLNPKRTSFGIEALIEEIKRDEERYNKMYKKTVRKRKLFLTAYWLIIGVLAYRVIF